MEFPRKIPYLRQTKIPRVIILHDYRRDNSKYGVVKTLTYHVTSSSNEWSVADWIMHLPSHTSKVSSCYRCNIYFLLPIIERNMLKAICTALIKTKRCLVEMNLKLTA